MGVSGLSTFVKHNQKLLLRSHRLHHTRVIIDGNNLVHFLQSQYQISPEFGGDYDSFADTSRAFFNNLKQCYIEPYVVFDGANSLDDRKLNRVRTKAQNLRAVVNKICTHDLRGGNRYLILAREVFRQVLVELEIAHAACHFEADKEIAVLAKKWKCPQG